MLSPRLVDMLRCQRLCRFHCSIIACPTTNPSVPEHHRQSADLQGVASTVDSREGEPRLEEHGQHEGRGLCPRLCTFVDCSQCPASSFAVYLHRRHKPNWRLQRYGGAHHLRCCCKKTMSSRQPFPTAHTHHRDDAWRSRTMTQHASPAEPPAVTHAGCSKPYYASRPWPSVFASLRVSSVAMFSSSSIPCLAKRKF